MLFRSFREENQKAMVAAKEAQRQFALDNIGKAEEYHNKSLEHRRKANELAVTSAGSMGAHGLSALAQQMATQENARHNTMWANIQDKTLKAKYAEIAAHLQTNIPEVMKMVQSIKTSMPEFAKTKSDSELLDFAADKIAQARGAENSLEAQYMRSVEARNKNLEAALQNYLPYQTATQELEKARKSGSKLDIDKAMEKQKQTELDVARRYPMPEKPVRAGIPPTSAANPSAKPKTIPYDVKGNPIVTPSPVPAP